MFCLSGYFVIIINRQFSEKTWALPYIIIKKTGHFQILVKILERPGKTGHPIYIYILDMVSLNTTIVLVRSINCIHIIDIKTQCVSVCVCVCVCVRE